LGLQGAAVYFAKKSFDEIKESEGLYIDYYDLLNQWVQNKNDNKSVVDYLKQNKFNSVAIYGIDDIAIRLYEELKNTEIKLNYFIVEDLEDLKEKNIDDISIIDKYEIESLEKVDAIIITDIKFYDEIEEELMDLDVDSEIISIEDLIYEI